MSKRPTNLKKQKMLDKFKAVIKDQYIRGIITQKRYKKEKEFIKQRMK